MLIESQKYCISGVVLISKSVGKFEREGLSFVIDEY